jgi:CheY-like chemotaxis protein
MSRRVRSHSGRSATMKYRPDYGMSNSPTSRNVLLPWRVMAKKILVVEDNEDLRQIFASIIRVFGYQVLEAGSGGEGIEKAAFTKPNLILLDLSLPDMSGIAAARAIKKNQVTTNIPIISCSAYPRDEIMKKALRAGAVYYLQKPISAALMKAKIEEFILP